METTVQKWGNSLAVRLSKDVVHESKISEGARVAVEVDEGRIILEVLTRKRYSLRTLLAQVNRNNVHSEFDLGGLRGKEIW